MKKDAKIRRLNKALEKVAFASLIADMCIAAVTVASLKVGVQATVGIVFILNYILTAIVIFAIVLFVAVGWLMHYNRISKVISLFRFSDK